MPRQDWHDDNDYMMRDRDYRDFERMNRERGGYDDRNRGAFFGDRSEPSSRPRHMGGWGSLLNDESSGGRDRMGSRSEGRRERGYGPDDQRQGIPTDETERLIASNKVEGTPVYDRNGDRLGSIHNFMVDKFRGNVVYAVLKHSSGFLGLDERYYPLEWDQLTYDTHLGGYHIDMVEDQLKRRGSWDRGERWQDRESSRHMDRERMQRDGDYERRMRDPW
jgi:sporulation protein YlmC with PRC-barrel domain